MIREILNVFLLLYLNHNVIRFEFSISNLVILTQSGFVIGGLKNPQMLNFA